MTTEYELRVEAAGKGAKRYVGKPCDLHHDAERYTSNGVCVECTKVKRAARHNVIRDLLKKNSA